MLLVAAIGASFNVTGAAVYAALLVFTVLIIWACVGIARSAGRLVLNRSASFARRIAAGLAIMGVLVVLFLTAQDIWHLFLA
jgi:hypothetical protein